MSISHYFNYRPMSILAISGGVRDILLGIGFITGAGQITQTLIYQNYNQLIPGITGLGAGCLFLLVGLLIIWAALRYNRTTLSTCLRIQAFCWFFSTLMYVLNGHFLLAAIFGIFFSFPAGYIGFYVKHHAAIDIEIRQMLGKP